MSKNIVIQILDNEEDFKSVKELRHQVFVVGKGIPKEVEFDGNDFSASYCIAKKDNKVIGCARIRYFGDTIKLERMVVMPEYRGNSLSKRIFDYAAKFCSQKGFKKISSVCEKGLLPHWEKSGFKSVSGANSVFLGQKEFVPIEYDISQLSFDKVNCSVDHQKLCLKESSLIDKEVVSEQNDIAFSAIIARKQALKA